MISEVKGLKVNTINGILANVANNGYRVRMGS